MKIYNYIFLCGVACATAANATDANIYVALGTNATCNYGTVSGNIFTLSCSDGNYRDTVVKVLSYCAGTDGDPGYAGTPEPDFDADALDNKYCWCRMITPGVGPWLYVGASSTASACATGGCIQLCQEYFKMDSNALVQSMAYTFNQ